MVKQFDRAGVIFREDASPNYWEIGTYLPEAIKGAGLIYVGRISRERRPRGWRYTVHSHKGTYTAYSRASAINNAHALAVTHPSYQWRVAQPKMASHPSPAASTLSYKFDDGGRVSAGRKGDAGDCVTRAIAIAAGLPYGQVYDRLADMNAEYRGHRRAKAARGRRTASHGIVTRAKAFKAYMAELGWTWTPTMQIGSGCKVHLRDGELPMGRLIVAVSRHYTVVIDGVIRDTFDPRRDGGRCVYGYWRPSSDAETPTPAR